MVRSDRADLSRNSIVSLRLLGFLNDRVNSINGLHVDAALSTLLRE